MASRHSKLRPKDLDHDEACAEAYTFARKHALRWADPKFVPPPGVARDLWLWVQTVGSLKDKFDALRKQSQRFAQAPDGPVTPAVDVARAAVQRADLREAMDALPVRLRKIVDAVYFNGMTLEAVARKFKVSQPAISKNLDRAFDLMRGVLGEDYGAE